MLSPRAYGSWHVTSEVTTKQYALCSPLPNVSVIGIHYPVISMQILPRRKLLSSRLEHPHPIALLRQQPSGSNGHMVYYVTSGQLAIEVRFPDALHSVVLEVVYAFASHESQSLIR